MPARCVVAGCSNTRDIKNGVALHTIPFYGNDRPEAKKRRKRWVDFVKQKCGKWELSKTSVICSTHFKAEDFVRRFMNTEGELGSALTPWLKRDDFGIAVFPSIHAFAVSAGKEEPLTDRDKRMVRYRMYAKYTCNFSLVVLKVIR